MKSVRIQLKEKTGADQMHQDADRGDKVLWQNLTSRGRTITFSVWPFVEPPEPILVNAKDKSGEYTIAQTATLRAYAYVIDPSINPDDGPPDEPSLDVGN